MSHKVDWTTLLRTSTDSGGRKGLYFGDGTLITTRTASETMSCNTSWGSLYRGVNADFFTLAPLNDIDFVSTPDVIISMTTQASSSFIPTAWENATPNTNNSMSRYAIPAGAIGIVRPTTSSSINLYIQILGIGRWK